MSYNLYVPRPTGPGSIPLTSLSVLHPWTAGRLADHDTESAPAGSAGHAA
jgi:hypothetical protein